MGCGIVDLSRRRVTNVHTMYSTPMRRVKRRLFMTPSTVVSAPVKRFRSSTGRVRQINKRTAKGPSRRGSLFQQVRSLQRVVKNLAPETKYIDISLANANIPTTGAVTPITAIGQGDTQSTRTGNTINVTDIAIRAAFTPGADIPVTGFARFAIVCDKEQIADTQPAVSDVFSTTVSLELGLPALPNLDNLERFRVLHLSKIYDFRRMQLDTDTTTTAPTHNSYFEWNWKGNIKVSFNGAATSDFEKNNLYFLTLLTGNDIVDLVGVARVGYTDV